MERIGQKASINGKYTQLQQLIIPFYTKGGGGKVAFIIFNSSKHKKHFGTVMLVQMQLSPTLSDQNKTLNSIVSLTKSTVRNQP